MDFYERYINGETKAVYDDIYKLEEKAFLPENLFTIEKVLEETFRRTAVNLEIIYSELQRIDYQLKTEFQNNSDKPLVKPLPNTVDLLKKLDETVKPFGFVPLSLKKFYQIVGACNFAWDYEVNENFFWDYADPIQIMSLDDLVSFITDEYWFEEIEEYLEDDLGPAHLELAADYFHKDNVSGGAPYSLEITKKPSIDGLFLNELHNTTFVDYLRICFENCGFSNISKTDLKNDYQSFFSRVKPQMIEI
jgi:hypothetical protein